MTHCGPFIVIVVIVACFGLSACQPQGLAPSSTVSTSNGDARFTVETVATGLEVSWGFAWLPNGDLLFTERPGRVRVFEGGKLRSEPVYKVPDVEPSSESGLMDISVHPDFANNGFVYLGYAYNSDGKRVKVVRFRFVNNTLTEPTVIIENIPGAPNHAGMRARFGPDGKLYVATGDSTDWDLAQKLDSLAGKTLRLNDDGTVPEDNPFVNTPGARPEIWSYGHRNAQGMAWQPGSGLMFQTEHGPSSFEGKGSGGDEVNIVEIGKNYGWAEIHHNQTREGMISPLLEYSPACAPASAMFYNGSQFPAFKSNFFFGCLAGKRIIRVVLDGRKVVSQEDVLKGVYGRIREMAEGPEGYIYFSTSNRDGRGSPTEDDDRIMRIVPVNQQGGFIMSKTGTKIDRRDDVNPQEGESKYGDVKFADPTNNKYPIDTEEHVRAAWSYIHHKDNAAKYDPDEVETIKGRIKRAAKNFDIDIEAE